MIVKLDRKFIVIAFECNDINEIENNLLISKIIHLITESFSNDVIYKYRIFNCKKNKSLKSLRNIVYKYQKKHFLTNKIHLLFFFNIKIVNIFFQECLRLEQFEENASFSTEGKTICEKFWFFDEGIFNKHNNVEYNFPYEITHLFVLYDNKKAQEDKYSKSLIYKTMSDKLPHILNFKKIYIYDKEYFFDNNVLEKLKCVDIIQ